MGKLIKHEGRLIHIASGLSKIEKIIFKNLKDLKIQPENIPLTSQPYKSNYRCDGYIIYPTDPNRPITGVSHVSKENMVYNNRKLGQLIEFPNAFTIKNKYYDLIVIFNNPLEYYINEIKFGINLGF